MNDIFHILNIPPHLRSSEHIADLMKLTRNVAFFQKITVEQNSNTVHKECCKVMSYEKHSENQIIFNIGDKGEKFYIILSGTVSIKIPIKKKLKIKKTTAKKIQEILDPEAASYDKDKKIPIIIKATDMIDQINSIRQSIENEVNAKQQILDTEEKNMLNIFKSKAEKEKKILMDLIRSSEMDTIEIEMNDLKDIGVIGQGSSFGELALISDRPRSATIQTIEECSFLVLNKNDFTSILGSLAEQRLSTVISYMKKLTYFNTWSKLSLVKTAYYLQFKKYCKNQVLFSEGDPVDGVYFVKQGEIIITKKHEKSCALPSVFTSSPPEFFAGVKKKQNRLVDIKILIKGIHESIGGYEICENLDERMYSCACFSSSCEVYFISKANFLTKVKNIDIIKEQLLEESLRVKERYKHLCEVENNILIRKTELNAPSMTRIPARTERFYKVHSVKQLISDNSYRNLSSFKKNSGISRELTNREVYEAVNGRSQLIKKIKKLPEDNSQSYFSIRSLKDRLQQMKGNRII